MIPLRPGQIVALRGRPGSGRTVRLLSLGGHYRGRPPAADGIEMVTLVEGDGEPTATTTALGLVANVHEPEPMLTAGEHITERVRLLRRPSRNRRAECRWRRDRLPIPAQTLAKDLDPLGRHLLMLHVALVSEPDVVLIDDIDRGLTAADRETLLDHVRATGKAAVVTERELPDRGKTMSDGIRSGSEVEL